MVNPNEIRVYDVISKIHRMMELNELTDFGWTTYRAAKELSGWFDETGGVSGGCATFEWADVEGIAEVRAYIALVNGESA